MATPQSYANVEKCESLNLDGGGMFYVTAGSWNGP